MGQIISIQTFILGILGNVNMQFKRNDAASIRQELEDNLKNLSAERMNLSYIFVKQKRKIMANAIMMEELDKEMSKTYDTTQDIEDCVENCTTKVDIAFKSVENSLSAGLFDIRRSQADIIGRIEGYQLTDIRQEELRFMEAVKLVASLKSIFNDFSIRTRAINNLALNERISKLELNEGIFEYLKECILPQPGSMYSLLTDLIDRQFTFPQHKDDNFSLALLELLCTGVDVYLYMLAFLLHQYTILCHTYYHKNDLDKYNEYYLSGANVFDEFSSRLIHLSDKVVNVLVTVENLEFIRNYRKDVAGFIATKLDKLKPIKRFLLDNYSKLVQVNRPDPLEPNLNYTSSKIETPILEWTNNSALSYAIQFMGNSVEPYSLTSIWSNDTVGRLANPFVSIYRDPLERARVIFRKISNDTSQIVAVINNVEQVAFRDIDRDLYNAVNKLDEKEALKYVKIYLENGANASAVFENNRGAIHAAVQNNQWAVAEELIKTDANLVNAIDGNGHTPIYIATETGQESFVQNLLNVKGIDVNVPTSKKNHQFTALHCALYKGHTEIVKKLIQFPSIDVNAKTTDGFTALHFATYYNRTEIISMLSNDTRTDFNIHSKQIEIPLSLSLNDSTNDKHIDSFVNSGNVSPLQMASAFAGKFSIDTLIRNNKMSTTIHTKTNDGSNVLHFAALRDDEDVFSVIEAHMNINQTVDTRNDREFTPLYNACYIRNELNLPDILMENYCANVNIRLSNNKTMLHLAVILGQFNAVDYVSFNVLAIDAHGRTALHYAVWFGHTQMVNAIIRKGAGLNYIDFYGIPIIHLVINLTEDKALDIVNLFVNSDESFDLNVKGASSNTLLHYMCALEYVSVVKYLLLYNIDTNAVNDDGETALHVAAFVGNFDLLTILIDKVKMTYNPDQCTSVLCYAIKGKGTLKIIDFLVGHSAVFGHQELMASIEMHKNDIFNKYVHKMVIEDKSFRELFYASLQFANCNAAKYCFSDEKFRKIFPNSVIEPDNNWTALYYTLKYEGDLKMVQCIIENAPDYIATLEVYAYDGGKSLLHLAIIKDDVGAVDLLLDMGAPFDNADYDSNTQLHYAAQNGMNAVVKRLIEKGAIGSINKKNRVKQTPLYFAASGNGNLELVKYLLDLGANLDGDDSDNTLVFVAACANKTDVVMHFVSLGVDYTQANWEMNETPLHCAAKNNNLDLVNYLLDQDRVNVNAPVDGERTPISFAIQYNGDVNVVNSLLDKYAVIDNLTHAYRYCDNLLTIAIEQNKIDIARTLLLADVNIHLIGYQSARAPLHQAIISDNVEMVNLLLERGADYNAFGPDNKTAIELMIDYSSDRSIKFFAYDYIDKHNQTMLHLMAGQNKVEVVKTLLERGAYVDVQDSEGNSPLHLAAKNGNLDTVKMMCQMKQKCIRVELKNANNQTALDLARLNNQTEVVEFLEQWNPKQRTRRQIVEQFIDSPVASSSASSASWWVRDLIGSVFDTFGSITKQTYQSMLSSSYHESAQPHSISTSSPSINIHGTLLLLDVLARKFTGQSYVGTDSHSVSPLHARSNSLCIVQQFERILNRLANETNSQLVSELDSFNLYRRVEHCLLSGRYSKIDHILFSTTREMPYYDSVDDSLLVMSVEELLSEVLFGKCRFEFGVD